MAGPAPLPNLVIAGVSKAGTTTLFDLLSEHPQVCPSSTKETRYFQAVRYGEPLAPLEDYRSYFRGCTAPVVMECTPDYFYGGAATAAAIAETCDPRILLILREPVGRLLSFFRFQRARLQLPAEMTLADYVERCADVADDAMNDRANNVWTGVWGGHYDRFLPAWLERYGERCRIEFFDTLSARPTQLLRGVCSWLSIDDGDARDLSVRTRNATVDYRSPAAQRVAARAAKMVRPVLARHPRLASRARRTYESLNERAAQPEPLPEELRGRLQELYRPSVERLRTQLVTAGVASLPDWVRDG